MNKIVCSLLGLAVVTQSFGRGRFGPVDHGERIAVRVDDYPQRREELRQLHYALLNAGKDKDGKRLVRGVTAMVTAASACSSFYGWHKIKGTYMRPSDPATSQWGKNTMIVAGGVAIVAGIWAKQAEKEFAVSAAQYEALLRELSARESDYDRRNVFNSTVADFQKHNPNSCLNLPSELGGTPLNSHSLGPVKYRDGETGRLETYVSH